MVLDGLLSHSESQSHHLQIKDVNSDRLRASLSATWFVFVVVIALLFGSFLLTPKVTTVGKPVTPRGMLGMFPQEEQTVRHFLEPLSTGLETGEEGSLMALMKTSAWLGYTPPLPSSALTCRSSTPFVHKFLYLGWRSPTGCRTPAACKKLSDALEKAKGEPPSSGLFTVQRLVSHHCLGVLLRRENPLN